MPYEQKQPIEEEKKTPVQASTSFQPLRRRESLRERAAKRQPQMSLVNTRKPTLPRVPIAWLEDLVRLAQERGGVYSVANNWWKIEAVIETELGFFQGLDDLLYELNLYDRHGKLVLSSGTCRLFRARMYHGF